MCEHGQEQLCRVPVHPADSHDGQLRWADKAVDACLADRVNGLNRAGRFTRSCCCGHGKTDGSILLHDGTVIPVHHQPFPIPHSPSSHA